MVSDCLVEALSIQFHRGVPQLKNINTFSKSIGELICLQIFPTLEKYQQDPTKTAVEEFLSPLFSTEISVCSRHNLCLKCSLCINLYRLYLFRKDKLVSKRNSMYYNYLVILFFCFCFTFSRKRVTFRVILNS